MRRRPLTVDDRRGVCQTATSLRRPQWLPRPRDGVGVLLAFVVAFAAWGLRLSLPRTDYLSDVFLALVLGVVVLNTPLRTPLGLQLPSEEREPDRYAHGLRWSGKWLLRGAIILMGLEVRTQDISAQSLLTQGLVLLCVVPGTFFVTHTAGALLKLRRPLVDVLAAGTMICGASAVNATAPVVRARREEQGLAIAVVFLFSVVALLLYKPIADVAGLSLRTAGMWSGMAVNDLSSAVAVGAQMGSGGDVIAAAAKSLRILFLAPSLVIFSLLRRAEGPQDSGPTDLSKHLPRFILGYIILAGVRIFGDATLGADHAVWSAVLSVSAVIVDFAILTVVAGVGLHIDVSKLWRGGTKAVATGASASLWLAGSSFVLLVLIAAGKPEVAVGVGSVALLVVFGAYRWAASPSREELALWKRYESGAPFALSEAIRLLRYAESMERVDLDMLTKLMRQLHPSIGELIPIRESPLPHGEGCKWLTYWQGRSGWALVAVCRAPGAATPIHAHSHPLIGKTIEGQLEETRFSHDGDGTFRIDDREVLDHNHIVALEGGRELHAIRALGSSEAIDLQFRGPELPEPGVRVDTDLEWTAATVGVAFAGTILPDLRPGQHGDGPESGHVEGHTIAE